MYGHKQSSRNSQSRRNRAVAVFEACEPRQMMSVTPQVNFPTFAGTSGLVFNGYGTDAKTASDSLNLTTTAIADETRSVWDTTAVPVDAFQSNFVTTAQSVLSEDGFSFAIQNSGTNALGGNNGGMGYSGITHSIGFLFNLSNGVMSDSSTFSVDTNGSAAGAPNGLGLLDLNGNSPIDVSLNYDGKTLTVTATNPLNSTQTFSWSNAMNIPALIGSDTAYVGFTGASSLSIANQTIQSWDFTGYSDPTIVNTPTPSQSDVLGRFVDLNTLGSDAGGEPGLSYDWSIITMPRGAKDPLFTDNGDNTAKTTNARFYKAGHYVMQMTVTNAEGLTAVQDVAMDVAQTATSVRMTPHNLNIKVGKKEQFSSTLIDQFGHSIAATPTYTVSNSRGSIGSDTGLFTAGSKAGHILVDAVYSDFDNILGTVGVTVDR